MVSVKQGDTVRAENVRSGTSAKGEYLMFRIAAEKGNKKITVWNNDGFQCGSGDMVRIDDIQEVKLSSTKGKDDKWYDNFDVTCALSLANAAPSFQELDEADGELPF